MNSIGDTLGNGLACGESTRLNVVCLTGRLVPRPKLAVSLRPGWAALLLEVRRQADMGQDEPGVLPVALVLPPPLAAERFAFRPGDNVTVFGRLDVEVDYSFDSPRAYHSVIAHQIETSNADPFAASG
jgi:hypothetical protein